MPANPAPQLSVLGEVCVAATDAPPVPLAAAGANLMTALAIARGQAMSSSALIDLLWPEELPRNPKATLQSVVSRTRSAIPAGMVSSTATGYRLNLAEGQIDLLRAERAIAIARDLLARGDAAEAAALAASAAAMWTGPVGTGVTNEQILGDLERRADAAKAALVPLEAEALIASGRPALAVPLLALAAEREPLHDQIALLQARALVAAGRTTEAIEACSLFRLRVREQLGIDPDPRISALHETLLRTERAAVSRRAVPPETDETCGRQEEIAALLELVRSQRVVTITGIGGIGKSRVARAVARSSDAPSAVLVDAGSAHDLGGLVTSLRDSLGLPESPKAGHAVVGEDLIAELTAAPRLLVLDTGASKLGAAGELVASLHDAAPSLRILTTSRLPLGVAGEVAFPLDALPVHDAHGGPGPAFALFEARARQVRPGAHLDPNAVAMLCEHLEGLPLAIELAAMRVRTMTVGEIDSALTDRFALLTSPQGVMLDRHRALEEVIAWSWDQLAEPTRQLCRRLVVLPDGFDARAAAQIAALDRVQTLDALAELLTAGLATATEDAVTTVMRYRLRPSMHEYAHLIGNDAERTLAQQAAAGWARDLAVDLLTHLGGEHQVTALRRLALEDGNLHRVLRMAAGEGDLATFQSATVMLVASAIATERFADAIGLLITPVRRTVRAHDSRPDVAIELSFWILTALIGQAMGAPREAMVALARLRQRLAAVGASRAPRVPRAITALARVLVSSRNPAQFLAGCVAQMSSEDPATARLCALITAFLAGNVGEVELSRSAAVTASALAKAEQDVWTDATAARLLATTEAQGEDPAAALGWLERSMSGFAELGLARDQDFDLRTRLFARLRTGDLAGAERDLSAIAARTRDGADAALVREGGNAELLLARGQIDAGLARYRSALHQADWEETTTALWRMMLGAACLTVHVANGQAGADGLSVIAERLRGHVVRIHRAHPENTDLPLLGVIGNAFALWCATDPQQSDRAQLLWRAAQALAPRQDLPSLERERLASIAARLGLATDEDPESDGGSGRSLDERVLELLERT